MVLFVTGFGGSVVAELRSTWHTTGGGSAMSTNVRNSGGGAKRVIRFALATVLLPAVGSALIGCSGSSAETSENDKKGTPQISAPGFESGQGNAEGADEFLGAWTSDEPGEPRLEFEADGTVSGTDGCNGISTTFTMADGVATLEPWASTAKACLDVDDWLRGASETVLEGDELIVKNTEGEEIGRLQRG